MPQQVKESKVTDRAVNSPRILNLHGFVAVCGFSAPSQTVVLDVVSLFEARNSYEGLKQEKDVASLVEEAHTEGEPKCG